MDDFNPDADHPIAPRRCNAMIPPGPGEEFGLRCAELDHGHDGPHITARTAGHIAGAVDRWQWRDGEEPVRIDGTRAGSAAKWVDTSPPFEPMRRVVEAWTEGEGGTGRTEEVA